MGFDYDAKVALATKLIAKFGRNAVLKRTTYSGATPHNPVAGTPTDTNYDIKVAFMTYNTYEIDGTLIKAEDKKIYLSLNGLSITPLLSDKIVVGSVEHAIVNIKPMQPADVAVFYELQARV